MNAKRTFHWYYNRRRDSEPTHALTQLWRNGRARLSRVPRQLRRLPAADDVLDRALGVVVAHARVHQVADAVVVTRQNETDSVLQDEKDDDADEEDVEDVADALAASTACQGALRRVERHSERGDRRASPGLVSMRCRYVHSQLFRKCYQLMSFYVHIMRTCLFFPSSLRWHSNVHSKMKTYSLHTSPAMSGLVSIRFPTD